MILGNIKKRVLEWSKTLPPGVAKRRLLESGVSLSATYKLLTENYCSNPKQELELKLIRAMKKKAS